MYICDSAELPLNGAALSIRNWRAPMKDFRRSVNKTIGHYFSPPLLRQLILLHSSLALRHHVFRFFPCIPPATSGTKLRKTQPAQQVKNRKHRTTALCLQHLISAEKFPVGSNPCVVMSQRTRFSSRKRARKLGTNTAKLSTILQHENRCLPGARCALPATCHSWPTPSKCSAME